MTSGVTLASLVVLALATPAGIVAPAYRHTLLELKKRIETFEKSLADPKESKHD